jgi:hypothetical protein
MDHLKLCSPTPEAGQLRNENTLRQTGQLRGLPGGWQCVTVSPNPQAPTLMGTIVQEGRRGLKFGRLI